MYPSYSPGCEGYAFFVMRQDNASTAKDADRLTIIAAGGTTSNTKRQIEHSTGRFWFLNHLPVEVD